MKNKIQYTVKLYASVLIRISLVLMEKKLISKAISASFVKADH